MPTAFIIIDDSGREVPEPVHRPEPVGHEDRDALFAVVDEDFSPSNPAILIVAHDANALSWARRPVRKSAVHSTSGMITPGWVLLERGSICLARERFSENVIAMPSDGLPKIGLAITSAMLNDHETAVWAMRQALRTDPGAVQRFTPDGNLRRTLRELADQYVQFTAPSNVRIISSSDALFAEAVMRLLSGDIEGTGALADELVAAGDAFPNTSPTP